MDTVTIRYEIRKAENHESNTHELASLLHRRLHHLSPGTVVPRAESPDQMIFLFVCNFINRTPTLLDILLESARGTSREDICDTVTVICLEFFMSPPPLLHGRRGLNGAMGKSYLCQRMIEELNDCCTLRHTTPLLPVDLSCSNLIVHQLIGRPLASMLDGLVENTVCRLQELAAITTGNPGDGERLMRLCRRRALRDNDLMPVLSTGYLPVNGTVH